MESECQMPEKMMLYCRCFSHLETWKSKMRLLSTLPFLFLLSFFPPSLQDGYGYIHLLGISLVNGLWVDSWIFLSLAFNGGSALIIR